LSVWTEFGWPKKVLTGGPLSTR